MQTFTNLQSVTVDVFSSGDTDAVLTVAPNGTAQLADGNVTTKNYTGTGPIGGGPGEDD